jgi:DNA-binding response OmpR family regulator
VTATVLVVEDEVDLLFTISLSLELNGYLVVKAASGEEALQLVDTEDPDAIVLDLRLPGIGGRSCAGSARWGTFLGSR